MNYLRGYLVDWADVDPQLDSRHQLGWDVVENALDEEEEASRVEEGALGDHELVAAPKYCGKWLADDNKWRRDK